jgi:hypothetical protein
MPLTAMRPARADVRDETGDDSRPRAGKHRDEDRSDRIEEHRQLERADDGAEREVDGDRARNQRERECRERTSGRKGHRRITYYSQRASHHTHRIA